MYRSDDRVRWWFGPPLRGAVNATLIVLVVFGVVAAWAASSPSEGGAGARVATNGPTRPIDMTPTAASKLGAAARGGTFELSCRVLGSEPPESLATVEGTVGIRAGTLRLQGHESVLSQPGASSPSVLLLDTRVPRFMSLVMRSVGYAEATLTEVSLGIQDASHSTIADSSTVLIHMRPTLRLDHRSGGGPPIKLIHPPTAEERAQLAGLNDPRITELEATILAHQIPAAGGIEPTPESHGLPPMSAFNIRCD